MLFHKTKGERDRNEKKIKNSIDHESYYGFGVRRDLFFCISTE